MFPIEKFLSLITAFVIIHCLLHYLSSGRLQEVKNNFKSGHGHLQEVIATGGSIVIFFLISRMFDLKTQTSMK